MDDHFRAFSFVDRITSVHEGRRIRGRYTIPSRLIEFPLALVGEAVGQLAAWAAMAAVNFDQRPVAGLAGCIELFPAPRAGQVLELAADLENVDADSVEYNGTAHVDGRLVMRLQDCVGPMMPLADFDDPQALRKRFEELCQSAADLKGSPEPAILSLWSRPPGLPVCGASGSAAERDVPPTGRPEACPTTATMRIAGPELPQLTLERTGGDPGRHISATFQVPSEAPLFADHFPRRHVFPGSLLMHLNLQLGAALASEIAPPPGSRWVAGTILDMKLRSFIPPGAALRFEARLKQRSNESATLALETRTNEELIATSGLGLKAGEII
jgi:3-hydroxymyristoyl/3-hydroxydecanoyl-(acyl carrier protein) dehydratase